MRPPPEIIRAAREVGLWFKRRGIKNWCLGPCADRGMVDVGRQAIGQDGRTGPAGSTDACPVGSFVLDPLAADSETATMTYEVPTVPHGSPEAQALVDAEVSRRCADMSVEPLAEMLAQGAISGRTDTLRLVSALASMALGQSLERIKEAG